MSLWSFLMGFFFDAPKPPLPRRRRLRAVCEGCGKEVAVIKSTGRFWKHDAAPGVPCPPSKSAVEP